MSTVKVAAVHERRESLPLWLLVRRPDIATIITVGRALIDALRENA